MDLLIIALFAVLYSCLFTLITSDGKVKQVCFYSPINFGAIKAILWLTGWASLLPFHLVVFIIITVACIGAMSCLEMFKFFPIH